MEYIILSAGVLVLGATAFTGYLIAAAGKRKKQTTIQEDKRA